MIMVTNSQQQTGTMTGRRGTSTVLGSWAGVGGGIITAASPIKTVSTTTDPVPQMPLGFGGDIGMVLDIP